MNNLFKKLLVIGLLTTSCGAFAAVVENKDYVLLEQPVISQIQDKDKIEVVEFFNYGCPYCYMMEPELSAWLADKPANVVVTKIAIPRKGKWVEYARLFYALEMISPAEQQRVSPLIYSAIHQKKLNFADEQQIFAWAEKNGVNRSLLEQYYQSQAVTDKLLLAAELAKRYQLKYVPSIYVDNKYQLILDSSNRYKGTKDKLNELIIFVGD